MTTFFLGLGSNLGDRAEYLSKARKLLQNHPRIKLFKISSIHETEPVGIKDQPKFLNQVIQIETDLAPLTLLHYCLSLEKQLGRVRIPTQRFGPRKIDIDLLWSDTHTMNTRELTLPHPRMHEREFVMVPLIEIAPEMAEQISYTH